MRERISSHFLTTLCIILIIWIARQNAGSAKYLLLARNKITIVPNWRGRITANNNTRQSSKNWRDQLEAFWTNVTMLVWCVTKSNVYNFGQTIFNHNASVFFHTVFVYSRSQIDKSFFSLFGIPFLFHFFRFFFNFFFVSFHCSGIMCLQMSAQTRRFNVVDNVFDGESGDAKAHK